MLCVSPLLAQSNPSADSLISDRITAVANAEAISDNDLEKAYIAYKAAYQYGKLMEFGEAKDFGELFDRVRVVTTKLKYVGNAKLSDAAYEELKKFEGDDVKFDSVNKAEFLEISNAIADGLKNAMEGK